FLVVAGFPATSLLGYLIIPTFGWRPMFVIAGTGSLIVLYLRKNLPESPRWESRSPEAGDRNRIFGRKAAAERGGAGAGRAGRRIRHAEAAAAATPDRRLLGADHDQHIDLRLRDLPAAIFPAPGTDHHQFAGLYAGVVGRLTGRLRAWRLPFRRHRTALEHYRCLDRHHHRRLHL